MTMRVAIVNPVWEPAVRGTAETLHRFRSLTGWASAVAAAGATVTVHQRFPSSARIEHGGLPYDFVSDGGGPAPPGLWCDAGRVAASVRDAQPNLVHVNGILFPQWFRALRRALPGWIRLVAQDHGGWNHRTASGPARHWIRRGLSVADAVIVSSVDLADAWREAGVVPARVHLADVMEASTNLRPIDRRDARAWSGVSGDPAILWVGRLMPNKDPLTMLEGFARFVAVHPSATLTMVFNSGTMAGEVQERIARDVRLSGRVRLVGEVPANLMVSYYSGSDIYVSASRFEGSGYAAIEAMACGVAPVLTDIPSFRAVTADGRAGQLWHVGQPQSLCDALVRTEQSREAIRDRVRSRFELGLSWEAIGRRAVEVYRDVCAR